MRTPKRIRTVVVYAALVAVLIALVFQSHSSAQRPDPVTIEFWHGWDGARGPIINEVIRRFEARYPWIKVEQRIISPNHLAEQLTLGISANLAPDLAMIQFSDSIRFGLQNALLPLNRFEETDGFELDEYFYPPVKQMLQSHPLVGAGTYYYLPQLIDVNDFLFFNKDHFAEAGISVDSVPQTWQELETIARRLNRSSSGGGFERLGIDVAMVRYTEPFFNWLAAAGGRLYAEDLRTVILDDVNNYGISTLEWLVDFTNEVNHGLATINSVHPYAVSGFYEGRYSMMVRGAWTIFGVQEAAPDLDFGLAELPHRDGFDFRPQMSLGWGYGIPENAQHPEEAWLLLKFLTLEVDGGGYLLLQQGRPGASIAINLQPDYIDRNPYWPVIQNSINRSVPSEPTPPLPDVNNIIRNMVAEAVGGDYSPRAAAERAARSLQAALDEYWASVHTR